MFFLRALSTELCVFWMEGRSGSICREDESTKTYEGELGMDGEDERGQEIT